MISFCFVLLRQCLASSAAAAEFGLLGLVLNFMYAFIFILFILFYIFTFTTRLRVILFFYCCCCVSYFVFCYFSFVFGIYLISLLLSPLHFSLGLAQTNEFHFHFSRVSHTLGPLCRPPRLAESSTLTLLTVFIILLHYCYSTSTSSYCCCCCCSCCFCFCFLCVLLLDGAKGSRAHSRMILCGARWLVAGSAADADADADSAAIRLRLRLWVRAHSRRVCRLALSLSRWQRRLRSLCATHAHTLMQHGELLVTFVFVFPLCAGFSHALAAVLFMYPTVAECSRPSQVPRHQVHCLSHTSAASCCYPYLHSHCAVAAALFECNSNWRTRVSVFYVSQRQQQQKQQRLVAVFVSCFAGSCIQLTLYNVYLLSLA